MNSGVAHFANIQRCGSIWSCPVCSAKIRSERSEQIRQAIETHYAQGGRAFMLTLTVRHHRGETLKALFDTVAAGWTTLLTGQRWKDQRRCYQVRGAIRSLEITHGENGWHPHLHVLVLLNGTDRWEDRTRLLASELEARWITFVTRRGLDRPLEGIAANATPIHSPADAAAYIAKVQDPDADAAGIALEMTRHDLKEGRRRSRTPFQILRDFTATGDLGELARWREYEEATFRRRAITWSVGLRSELSIDDRTDEEIAEELIGGEPIAVLPIAVWRLVCRQRACLAALLRGAELAGVVGLRYALEAHGLPTALDPPPPRPD